MNCKPDDLAIVVPDLPADEFMRDMIVRVTTHHFDGVDYWDIERDIPAPDGSFVCGIEDSILRPLTPPSGSVTTKEVRELYSPSPVREEA